MDSELKSLARDLKAYLKESEPEDFIGSSSAMPPQPKANDISLAAPQGAEKGRMTPAAPQGAEKGRMTPQAAEKGRMSPQPKANDISPAALQSAGKGRPSPQPKANDISLAAPQGAGEGRPSLEALREEVAACRKCPLGRTRLHPAFGVGNAESPIMFVGEGPGYEEDHRGEPFVGKAGQLLDKILAAMTFTRESVYIANIVKCHPMINPENPEMRSNDRPPTPEEIEACRGYLMRQMRIIKPKWIVALGAVAAKSLLLTTKPLSELRGRVHKFPHELFGSEEGDLDIKLVATYHPAALLRNPNWKKGAWEDMQLVMREMGIKLPGKN